ncbi:ABC transporter substrate-binding protein [Beijerinckia sp. L45]|uniref:ABC transporter substrate-binding protein n=1 Tax=Beijerinckia sp. L45 TaxID=1641855 RepID=UPI001AEED0D3|nr:ABC transporter substrate-binding protein [Beijerinckia sp. L45]
MSAIRHPRPTLDFTIGTRSALKPVPAGRCLRKRGSLIRRLFAAVLLASAVQTPASAETPATKLTVNVFPGGFNWPLFVARDKGFFAARGLEIEVQPTTGSIAQMSGLATGKFDIAMTAIDNIVAYVEGQGDASVGKQSDFVAVMGSDSGFLSVVSAPAIPTFEKLRGQTLSVDARSTGYAFVFFDMLAREGLKATDYTIVPVGGMTQRWTAMKQGQQVATILSTPYDILAKAEGFHQLGWATHTIGPYQGNVAATKRPWAEAHRPQLVAYIRAYAAAIDWLYEPKNHDEAIKILRANLPSMSEQLAQQTYGELLDPKDGFFRQAKVDAEGVRTVLRLRSQYLPGSPQLSDASRYYDASFWSDAMTPSVK